MNNFLTEMEDLGWEYIETMAGGFYRKGKEHQEGDAEWNKDAKQIRDKNA